MIDQLLLALSSGILGVFLGAQICEAVLLVPYWKMLKPEAFFELHKSFGSQIYRFFAPLTIAATLIPIITAIILIIKGSEEYWFVLIMALSTILFFSTYFLFFKKANQQFAEASISYDALPGALKSWEKWHWGRIVFEAIAFICALSALV